MTAIWRNLTYQIVRLIEWAGKSSVETVWKGSGIVIVHTCSLTKWIQSHLFWLKMAASPFYCDMFEAESDLEYEWTAQTSSKEYSRTSPFSKYYAPYLLIVSNNCVFSPSVTHSNHQLHMLTSQLLFHETHTYSITDGENPPQNSQRWNESEKDHITSPSKTNI